MSLVFNQHAPSSMFVTQLLHDLHDASANSSSHLSNLKQINESILSSSISYFAFPGTSNSHIFLSPIKRWPQRNGWSLNCWCFLKKECSVPTTLFSFTTDDGLGYISHLDVDALVITVVSQKGKGLQHRVSMKANVKTWFMLTFTFINARFGKGEIYCYLDGKKLASVDSQWQLVSELLFNRCSLGGSSFSTTTAAPLCGKLTGLMGFVTALSAEQVNAIYQLGAGYQGSFQFDSECCISLSETDHKILYGGSQLHESLMFSYTPSTCERNLCLNRAPRRFDVFCQASHALICGDVGVILHKPTQSILHSIGGILVLYPLFEKLDILLPRSLETLDRSNSPNPIHSSEQVAPVLVDMLCNLCRSSPTFGHQFIQTRGFLLLANGLLDASSVHLTQTLLDRLINLARELLAVADSVRIGIVQPGVNFHPSLIAPLLRQFHTYVLCNMDIWIRAPIEIQDQLHQFLATEFLIGLLRHELITKTSIVVYCMHVLKYYYALVDPKLSSGFSLKTADASPIPMPREVLKLRANVLFCIKQLVIRYASLSDTEMGAVLNFFLTVHEDENLHDVLYLFASLLVSHPSTLGAAFAKNDGISVAMELLRLRKEENRIFVIKMLGIAIQQCKILKLDDKIERYHLLSLLVDRLGNASDCLSLPVYNALFEVLIDRITAKPQSKPFNSITPEIEFKNPGMIQVISKLLRHSVPNEQSSLVTQIFLCHLTAMCKENALNRRIILQIPVWQDCVLPLVAPYPITRAEAVSLACAIRFLGVMLFHAVRYERDGWRVWIDTVALVHRWMAQIVHPSQAPPLSSTTLSEFDMDLTEPFAKRLLGQLTQSNSNVSNGSQDLSSETRLGSDPPKSTVQPPKSPAAASVASPSTNLEPSRFVWSHIHQLLLDDLLYAIEIELCLVSANTVPHQYGATIRSLRSTSSPTQYSSWFPGQFIGISWDATDPGPSIDGDELVNQSAAVLYDPTNSCFFFNLVNLLSDCTDMLVCGSGGLLPLLAAATSASGEVGLFDSVPRLSINDALSFAVRIAFLADLCVPRADFTNIEKQRGMPSGMLVRQFTRLYLLAAVRNCLECRFLPFLPSAELSLQLKSFTNYDDGVCYVGLVSNQTFDTAPTEEMVSRRFTRHRSLETGPNSSQGQISFPYPPQFLPIDPSLEYELEVISTRLLCFSRLCSTHQSYFDGRLGLTAHPWRSIKLLLPEHLKTLRGVKVEHDRSIEHLTSELKMLTYSIRPVLCFPVILDKSFLHAVIQPVSEPMSLLQTRDLNRLQAVIFKSEDYSKGSESLILSVVYFITVLLVSKYRDLLEPNTRLFPCGRPSITNSSRKGSAATEVVSQATSHESNCEIPVTTAAEKDAPLEASETVEGISDTLIKTFSSTGSFLRDLFGEYSSALGRRLVGSQGQTLFSSGTPAFKHSQPIIELVMLLCSQEWQTSLQKYAGLAFIELINEGRMTWRKNRVQFLRIAEQLSTVLHTISAGDSKQHAAYDDFSTNIRQAIQDDFHSSDYLLATANCRDRLTARSLSVKTRQLLWIVWHNRRVPIRSFGSSPSYDTFHPADGRVCEFYKLDCWEDDSRRRRRFSPNPYGTRHQSAVLYQTESPHLPVVAVDAVLKEVGLPGAGTMEPVNSTDEMQFSAANQAPHTIDEYKSSTVALPDFGEIFSSLDHLSSTDDLTHLVSVPTILVSFGVEVPGVLSISQSYMRFDRDPSNRQVDKRLLVYVEPIQNRWSFSEIHAIFTRRYLHQTEALEIFVSSRTSILFVFENVETMQRIVNLLPPVGIGSKYGLPRTRAITLATPRQLFEQSNMTERWQRREVSNFDYLMYLNTISGRSYNDLNQYPIFPWILSNYTGDQLDLTEPSNYRDLSKPIGALDPKRKAFFDERYASWEDESHPPFHYGTHYSTAAFVLSYLLRVEPFTTLFLHLQSWKFDHPDRAFYSVGRTWENCQLNTTDVKELIPEFFYLPEMFENSNQLDLGVTESGDNIGHVALPDWAKSPEEFIHIHRQALESELVSCQLHHWIDLIFGYKQRGPEAIKATNVFHYLTYEGSVDWSKLSDPVLVKAVQEQIRSFGQTPSQLLRTPHPHRNSLLHSDPRVFCPLGQELSTTFKFFSHSPVVFISCSLDTNDPSQSLVCTVNANRSVVLSRWNESAADAAYQSALIQKRIIPASPVTAEQSATSDNTETSEIAETTTSDMQRSDRPSTESSNANLNVTHSISSGLVITSEFQPNQTIPHIPTPLGDDFDPKLVVKCNQFVATPDNRALIVCGYDDHSLRIYSVETGRIVQAVYGHFDIVTCIAHSELQVTDHCYLASGSRDCTVKLWIMDWRHLVVLVSQGSTTPTLTLFGHESEVTCVSVSAELGLVISGSAAGTCLLHSTRGGLLRNLTKSSLPPPGSPGIVNLVAYHRQGYLCTQTDAAQLNVFTLNGKSLQSRDLSALGLIPNYRLSAFVFSSCGEFVLVAGTDGVVWILRVHTLTPVHAFPRCDVAVRSLALTKDQRFVIAGLNSGSLVVFFNNFNQWTDLYQTQ